MLIIDVDEGEDKWDCDDKVVHDMNKQSDDTDIIYRRRSTSLPWDAVTNNNQRRGWTAMKREKLIEREMQR